MVREKRVVSGPEVVESVHGEVNEEGTNEKKSEEGKERCSTIGVSH